MELVGPPVEYTAVQRIPTRQTHPVLNSYVLQTVQFVNKFAAVCEQKLNEMSRHLERLETTMAFLEAKLKSIAWLEGNKADGATVLPEPVTAAAGASGDILGGDVPSYSFDDGASVMNMSVSGRPAAAPAAAPMDLPPVQTGPTVEQDPRFAKYFKMLKMGVPDAQVRMKVKGDGLDPSILDNPNAPASSIKNNAGSDDDLFSDAGNNNQSDDDFSD